MELPVSAQPENPPPLPAASSGQLCEHLVLSFCCTFRFVVHILPNVFVGELVAVQSYDPSTPPTPPDASTRAAASAAFAADSPPTSGRPSLMFGGPGGLSSLGLAKIKKPSRDELVDFTGHCPKSYPQSWAASPTERIREFDTFRLHTPGTPERTRTCIPSSIDRINITNLNHLMVLCGGYGSVRFTTEVCPAPSRFFLIPFYRYVLSFFL